MSYVPRQKLRRRRRFQVELLEGRALLSASSVSSADRFLLITPSSEFVTQQDSAFTVTLTLARAARKESGGRGRVHGCCVG